MNWGDSSTTTTGTVTGSAGIFTVTGTHTYTTDSLDQPNGADTVTVTLTGPNETTLNSSGNQTLTATKAVAVERPPLTGFGDDVLATPSVTFTNVEVATFTDLDTSDGGSEFTATINWGDGTSSDGTVTGTNGLFHVLGSHSYTTSGAFAIEVDVSQAWDEEVEAEKIVGCATAEAADDEVAIQSITVTDDPKEKPVGGREGYGEITRLGPYAGFDRAGWSFNVTVTGVGDMKNAKVSQKIFQLVTFRNAQGQVTKMTLVDGANPTNNPKVYTARNTNNIQEQSATLVKDWEDNKDTFAQDSPPNIVKVTKPYINLQKQTLTYNDSPGFPGTPFGRILLASAHQEETVEWREQFVVTATGTTNSPGTDSKTITGKFWKRVEFKSVFLPYVGWSWVLTDASTKMKYPQTFPPPK